MINTIQAITLAVAIGPAALSLALSLFLLAAKKGHMETPNTPNQELIAAAVRAASAFLVQAHTQGGLLTNPALIADAIGEVDKFLNSNWRETADKAEATPADLSHIAASAVGSVVEGLAPVLQPAIVQAVLK